MAGCASGPAYHAPPNDAPTAFAATSGGAPASDAELASWWHLLGDPTLDDLVRRALRGNPDIRIALDRLQQAREYEATVLGRALPEVTASAAAGRGTGSDLTRSRASSGLVSADNASGLQHVNSIAGFDAAWEIDLFGRLRREYAAAHAGSEAAAAARSGVVAAVVADVVRGYLELRGAQQEARILAAAHDALSESLRVTRIRYERGITNELDVTLATRELSAISAERAPVEARARAAAYALATLVGDFPESMAAALATPSALPALPPAVGPGLPPDVLRRRPDVREAERLLAASTANIGVATAALFPRIGLVGALGTQGQGWGTQPVETRRIWSFGPGAIWPLLDVGALDAQLEIANLDQRIALSAYRRTVWNAVREVDTAVEGYAAERERVTTLEGGLEAAQRAVELAAERYDRGLTDFLNLVDAERALYDYERQYVSAEVSAGREFVALYKSLGGGWQDYQQIPAARRPLPAFAAAIRELVHGRAP